MKEYYGGIIMIRQLLRGMIGVVLKFALVVVILTVTVMVLGSIVL